MTPRGHRDASSRRRRRVVAAAAPRRRRRYLNLWELLGDRFSERDYVKLVANRVLVDVQGDDVLLQIFSRPVLSKENGGDAPSLEFIQRVCSKRELPRPGCGGFGSAVELTSSELLHLN